MSHVGHFYIKEESEMLQAPTYHECQVQNVIRAQQIFPAHYNNIIKKVIQMDRHSSFFVERSLLICVYT